MIHDVLLSLLSLSRNGLSIEEFLDSEAVNKCLHPCERRLFEEILEILKYHNEVARFAKFFGGVSQITNFIEADEYSTGYYLRNFAKGVEAALEDYNNAITRLESLVEKNEKNSLIFIYKELELQLPVILFLRKLINDAKIQKLHGCKLLQNLHQQYDHGDSYIELIIPKVTKPVKTAFLSQLCHWLLFGDIDDKHSEFFISYRSSDENDTKGSCEKSPNSCNFLTSVSEEDIWQYELNFSQLPSFLSVVLAEKVLFVGQTTLMFKINRSKRHNHTLIMKERGLFCDEFGELWDGQEGKYCKMIEDLNQDKKINVFHMEDVINTIKKHVCKRLSEIAVGEQDLDCQMYLIKDFYLLGRGEFYMEFFRQINKNSEGPPTELTAKNYTKFFETAASVMGMTDDLENFSLSVLKTTIDFDESCEFATLQNIHLKYIYKWPLNLLFSPTTIERYNTVFRFLLIVRKLQYDLESVWACHKLDAKTAPVNVKIMQFRNHLMFFINNLQYYIQVDVLESQFSILMNIIQSKPDFEEIQTAHSVFLANVLSQCFLLTDETDKKMNTTQPTSNFQYPVHGTILEIFSICEKFCYWCSLERTPDDDLKEMDTLEERFNVSILGLIKLLVNIKHSSSFGTLSQLLLRLDYNRWFSVKRNVSVNLYLRDENK